MGRLGPGCENVPRTAGRAKTARRWGSGGSAMGYAAHLRCARKGFGYFSTRAAEATPSRLTAEQGRYSAAAVNATAQRLAARGAVNTSGVDL